MRGKPNIDDLLKRLSTEEPEEIKALRAEEEALNNRDRKRAGTPEDTTSDKNTPDKTCNIQDNPGETAETGHAIEDTPVVLSKTDEQDIAEDNPVGRDDTPHTDPDFNPAPSAPTRDEQPAFTVDDFGEDTWFDDDEGTVDVDPGETTGASLTEIYRPDDEDAASHDEPESFEDALVSRGIVTSRELIQAQDVVKKSPGTRLADVLIERGAEERPVLETLASAWSLDFEEIDLDQPPEAIFDGTMLQRLGADFCREYDVLPLRVESGRVVLGTSRPDDVFMVDEARMRLKVRAVRAVVVSASQINAALEMLGEDEDENVTDVEDILGEIDEDDVRVEESDDDEVDLEREAAESPVIRYVNYIIQSAVKEGASDIHVEPGDKSLIVRFRIDGVLFESMRPPVKMAAALTSRLKIMANLDISERRIPQDGRIRCNVQGRKLDLRVSTLPTSYGEKTVMRILDTRSINVSLDELGFDENTLTTWKTQINQPYGIVLVTGPTGSGKTTTLYSSLRQMDKTTKNVSTVEDPVEYHLDGIAQTQVHEKIGMTFASALRALLRQDPDVIMVGEIRDMETAGIAIQAALTGHLVLSTLHTNDAPSAITRLVNIGIEPFLIGAAVNAVLAQRLVRRVCPHCKGPVEHTEEMREFLQMQGIDPESIEEGSGCEKCRQLGYTGRLGLYELLVIDDHLRDVVARNPNVTEFRRLCCERGMRTLRDDGFQKVREGQTTPAEILRVTEAMM